MKLPKDQPFWTAVILHLIVLFALFLSVIIEALKPKEKAHVFEMVSAPSSQSATTDAPSPEPLPALDLPDVTPMQDLPDVEIPTPAPAPARPTPTPQPKPPVQQKPKLISIDDFRKDNPIKPTPQPRPTPRPRVSVPQISVPQLVLPRSSPSNAQPSLTPQQINALGQYQSRIWSLLNAAWLKPSNLGGIKLTAVVVFDVSSAGRITNVRLSPGSGNGTFDQSVLAAFRKVTTAGPTPTGQSHSFKMPFKLD